MDFAQFLDSLPKIAKVPLPGEDAHLLMAPPERREIMKNLDLSSVNPRQAAVMMLIYPKHEQAFLALILRTSYNGVHSSQVAFPGGKIESYDASPLEAALRETDEEIGIPPRMIETVRSFTPVYIPPSNFCVSPFLGYCSQTPEFVPDPHEVAGIVELPLDELLNEANKKIVKMTTSYSTSIEVPVFDVAGHSVWGATAMMLSELKEVLAKTR